MLYNHDYATDSKHHERKGDDMPPKAKFTKDEMINVALAITRRSGIETVTARKMATELGVSTRPIFTYFKSIDELKRAVHARAMCVYRERIKEGLNSDIPFLGIGMRYLGFAKDEPNLYKLLYLSSDKYSDGNSAIELVKVYQELIRDTLMKIYNMTAEQADLYYNALWLVANSLALLIVNNSCPYSDEDIKAIYGRFSVSYCKAIKEIPGFTENTYDKDAIFSEIIKK